MKKKIYFSCNPYFPDSFQFKKVTWWRNIIIWICDLDIDWMFVFTMFFLIMTIIANCFTIYVSLLKRGVF